MNFRILCVLLVLRAACSSAFAQSYEYATARFIESQSSKLSQGAIVDGKGNVTPVPLGSFSLTARSNAQTFEGNQRTMTSLINDMVIQGYELYSITTGNGDAILTTFMVFRKPKEEE